MTLLTIEDLDVRYGKSQALRDISLEIGEGEIVGVIGPNGAGKTTLLDSISGLKDYDGTITFNDADLSNGSPQSVVSQGLIHCTEERDLFPFFSVEKNLLMGAYARNPDDVDERLNDVYELFPRLEERYDQNAGTMSGGERQMLAIGRSLMGDPELLMLDEPTLGLAPVIIDEISEALEQLRSDNVTVLLAEQNSTFALKHADRLYLLETGEIELFGPSDEFKDNEYIRDAYMGVV